MNAITLDNQTKMTVKEQEIYSFLEEVGCPITISDLVMGMEKEYKSTWRMVRNLYGKGILNLNPKPEYSKRGKKVLVSLWTNENSEDFLIQLLSNIERKRGRVSQSEYDRAIGIKHSPRDLIEVEKWSAAHFAEESGFIKREYVLTSKGRKFIRRGILKREIRKRKILKERYTSDITLSD